MSDSDEYILSDSGDLAMELSDLLGFSCREPASVSELVMYRIIHKPVVVISLSETSLIDIEIGSFYNSKIHL